MEQGEQDTTTGRKRPDPVLGWPLVLFVLGAVVVCLGLAFTRQLPLPVATLLVAAGLFTAGWPSLNLLLGLLATPQGMIRWEWLLFVICVVATYRYGAPLVAPGGFDTPRFILLVCGSLSLMCGAKMLRDRREEFAKKKGSEAGKGEPAVPDWHEDIKRYQVPLALYALGLALLQMAGK